MIVKMRVKADFHDTEKYSHPHINISKAMRKLAGQIVKFNKTQLNKNSAFIYRTQEGMWIEEWLETPIEEL